ncbi:hypothetical protein BBD41_27205 [Paenibacillus ihbetae]|uniref:GIY-YIG domain-containing protein n=1 Tax=Paenibacillus ihbetae TaxID=1870820 RepID=A0A1B2E7K8_9BACL|nr:GIY-YIG nuclease family protein [Paenibacillus ihbetae]ANY75966.1 hypothetical protein BBD41_27205 [Paenibacillus ihbetae]
MRRRQFIDNNFTIPYEEIIVGIPDFQKILAKSGVYKIYNEKQELMYVGQSRNLRRRIQEHFHGKRKGYFIHQVGVFYIENKDNFMEGVLLETYETELIRNLRPRFNKQSKAPTRFI